LDGEWNTPLTRVEKELPGLDERSPLTNVPDSR
jgi:hypothetical protein